MVMVEVMVECDRSYNGLVYSGFAEIALRVASVASAWAADVLMDHDNLGAAVPYEAARRFADELLRHAARVIDRAAANKDAESLIRATERTLSPQYLDPYNARPLIR
jgi:hypothetical protein